MSVFTLHLSAWGFDSHLCLVFFFFFLVISLLVNLVHEFNIYIEVIWSSRYGHVVSGSPGMSRESAVAISAAVLRTVTSLEYLGEIIEAGRF